YPNTLPPYLGHSASQGDFFIWNQYWIPVSQSPNDTSIIYDETQKVNKNIWKSVYFLKCT
ncbi:MAG: hypothetical protein KHX84_24815, partial [Enterocloster asparagiformis]|nr:hypothetical protein [Enterocloster asparagiformis]